MRAGPLSDEAVIRLFNRRFVSFHFDLEVGSYLGDADASEWVKKNLPQYSGRAVGTPPIVFVTPEGKIVGSVSNYAPTETVLAVSQKVLKENPAFNRLSAAEEKLTGIEKAQLLIDLQRYDEAAASLKSDPSETGQFLLGHLARLKNAWDTSEEHFAKITTEEWLDDVRMERAYQHWVGNDYPSLAKALADFPKDSNRFSEARYFEGLAYYHRGKLSKAKNIWKDLIKTTKEDRWIYRADWAFSQAGRKKQSMSFSTSGGKSTPLGRIGYMGKKHPDLQERK